MGDKLTKKTKAIYDNEVNLSAGIQGFQQRHLSYKQRECSAYNTGKTDLPGSLQDGLVTG